MEYTVLFTHQKTKKAKTWQDGVLSVIDNKAILYDDKKTKLDSMYIKSESIVKGEQLESDRYFIMIEDERSSVKTPREPVCPVICPVRVPVRTGLKRKRTGFVPPRVVKQPDNKVDQGLTSDTDSSGTSCLDLLKKTRLDSITGENRNFSYTNNVVQLYSTLKEKNQSDMELLSLPRPFCNSNSAKQSSSSTNYLQENSTSPDCQLSPLSSNNSISLGMKNQCSPWSSYGTKRKSQSPLQQNRTQISDDTLKNRAGTYSESTVIYQNDMNSEETFYDQICYNSENEIIQRNIDVSKFPAEENNVNIASRPYYKNTIDKESCDQKTTQIETQDEQSCDTVVPTNQNSKRSTSQIMALLGKQKCSTSDLAKLTQNYNQTRSHIEDSDIPVIEREPSRNVMQNGDQCNNLTNNDICHYKSQSKDILAIDNEPITKSRLLPSNQTRTATTIVKNRNIESGSNSDDIYNDGHIKNQLPVIGHENISSLVGITNTNGKGTQKTADLEPTCQNETLITERLLSREEKSYENRINYHDDRLEIQESNNTQKTTLEDNLTLKKTEDVQDDTKCTSQNSCDNFEFDDEDFGVDDNLSVSFNINYSLLSHISDTDSVNMDTDDTNLDHQFSGEINEQASKFELNDENVVKTGSGDTVSSAQLQIHNDDSCQVSTSYNPHVDKYSKVNGNIKMAVDDSFKIESVEKICSVSMDALDDKVIQKSDVMKSNNNSQIEVIQQSDVMRSNNNSQVEMIQQSDVTRSNNNSQVELIQKSDVTRSNNNSQVELIQKSDVMISNNNSQVDQVDVVETDQKEMLASSISEVDNHQNLNLETESRFLSSTKMADDCDKTCSKEVNSNKTLQIRTSDPFIQSSGSDLECGSQSQRPVKTSSFIDQIVQFNNDICEESHSGKYLKDLNFSPDSLNLSTESKIRNTQNSLVSKQDDDSGNVMFGPDIKTKILCKSSPLSWNCDKENTSFNSAIISRCTTTIKNNSPLFKTQKCAKQFELEDSVVLDTRKATYMMSPDTESTTQHFNTLISSTSPSKSPYRIRHVRNEWTKDYNNKVLHRHNLTSYKLNESFEVDNSQDEVYYITDTFSPESNKGINPWQNNSNKESQNKGDNSFQSNYDDNCDMYQDGNKATSSLGTVLNYDTQHKSERKFNRMDRIYTEMQDNSLSEYFTQNNTIDFDDHQWKPVSKPCSEPVADYEALQHPQDILVKKRKMKTDLQCSRQQKPKLETLNVREPVDQSKDLRFIASEKLESYTIRGSVVSGAATRQESSVSEIFEEEDDSFYIDFSTVKPCIQNVQSANSKVHYSPAQFVPNTPEFLKSLKIQGSTQNLSQSSEDELGLIEKRENLEDKEKQNQGHYFNSEDSFTETKQQLGVKIFTNSHNTSDIHRKIKIPLISSPYESIHSNLNENSYEDIAVYNNERVLHTSRNQSYYKSHDLQNNKRLTDVDEEIDGTKSHDRQNNKRLTDVDEEIDCSKKCNSSSLPNRKHSEVNLLQKCDNSLIKNDIEPLEENNSNSDISDVTYVISEMLGNTMSRGHVLHAESNDSPGQLMASKWGKYKCDMNENDDEYDFLTFDSTFSMPPVDDSDTCKKKFSLRPPTSLSHNDTLEEDNSFSLPPEDVTGNCDNKLSLRPPTSFTHNDTLEDDSSISLPHVDETGACDKKLTLQPATTITHNDTLNDAEHWTAIMGDFDRSFDEEEDMKFHCTSNMWKLESDRKNRVSQRTPVSSLNQCQYVPQTRYETSSNDSHEVSCDKPGKVLLKPSYSNSSEIIDTNTDIAWYDDPQVKVTSQANYNSQHGLNRKFKCPLSSMTENIRTSDDRTISQVDGDAVGTSKRFRCPQSQLTSYILKGTKRNLGSDLQFPSLQEITENTQPTREIEIPTTFTSLSMYKQVFTAGLKEHLNIILFDLGVKYHHALVKIDTTSYLPSVTGKENQGPVNSNPVCKCGAPSKMIQVKKSGPNHNRFFYTCQAARSNQCKFFQWVDDIRGCQGNSRTDKLTMSDPLSITTFVRNHNVHFYCGCHFIKKSTESIMNHFKRNVPNWVKEKRGIDTTVKKRMYIQLSRKDNSGIYSKDDLWIVSRHLDFRPSSTILCKSTYYGPTSANEVEIEPIAKFSPSNWSNEEECHAILARNVTGELSYLTNLEENITLTNVPVLETVLNSNKDRRSSSYNAPSRLPGATNIYVPESFVDNQVEEMISWYNLNEDQATALLRVSRMFTQRNQDDILLIHGVFGAGKSFLLSVVVIFLVWLFEKNDSYTPGVPFPWKLVIASTTNVAVDRILNGLLALGFEDFVRVGSVKKISKPVLPFSVHATGSDSQELKDLQMMLRSGELTTTEKQNVKQSIEKHKLGENRKRLGKVRVVGVTCASCSSLSLKDMKFPIVLLDECSQMTEPASMLPVAKFQCQKLVLVGDPKQLDPTIQGSESKTEHGLEQTIFDRLILMGHTPVMLHTQYRCHPHISRISNSLFYNNQLRDGVLQADRLPIMEDLPALCFYDVTEGIEQSDNGGSFYNEKEAEFIEYLIESLIDHDVDPERIGVISLYKSQMYRIVTLLGTNKNCKELRAVMVSTVDAFQGGERDVIILSCVRTRNVGFIDNEKRTNVALTRARNHLLIVGNENNLRKNQLWRQIIQQCKDTSSDGLQRANIVRQNLKSAESSEIKSKRKPIRTKTATLQLFEDVSSPPMSLSDSGKSLSLSTEDLGDKDGGHASTSHEYDKEGNTVQKYLNNVSQDSPVCHGFVNSDFRPRRKRRKIDASLLDVNENDSSDDEDLPAIFGS